MSAPDARTFWWGIAIAIGLALGLLGPDLLRAIVLAWTTVLRCGR